VIGTVKPSAVAVVLPNVGVNVVVTGLARRKPTLMLFPYDGSPSPRYEDDTK
jgi:hypothetical protein